MGNLASIWYSNSHRNIIRNTGGFCEYQYETTYIVEF